MSNSKASTSVSHFIIDVSNKEAVLDSLMDILSVDNDLTENEDYFRDDTMELGFESEADRIIKEYIKKNGVPNTIEAYEKAFNKISDSITNQEYFGECQLDFLKIDETNVSVMFMYGGQEDY